ncbi:MAG: hypothetical protein L6243_07065 [Candidatus Altiarchaeales archaeon]|nr:hypothetical protein [Candidatus Altiarchaeota archaeon]MBU4342090.1 hypothetical protein [Candidatus Altiarchaeota archaeon]MBU4436825.1 hypothetical protein [Candidatus Altiarchaeota archaeon]MCG2783331.1 hypothetical protein [Candidatus Altiarchaeales archaeon]
MVGAAPSFSEAHLVRALLMLSSGRVGRKNLVKILGVGEGSVRTIIKRLKGEGLIKSSKQGHELTQKGKETVENYLNKFSMPGEFKADDLSLHPGEESSSVIVYGAADRISNGLEQRDIARDAGATSIAILLYKEGILEFPTPEARLSQFPDSEKELEKMELREGDIVVISFGKSRASAENGAVAVALQLMN